MALAVQTVQPNSTSQPGTATVIGAASANAALSDGSDSSYIQISGLCRLDSQVCRVGFPLPTLPAGAQIYSVTLRRRIQTVGIGSPIPVCNHWFRTVTGIIEVVGQALAVNKTFFTSPCPVTSTSGWTTETIGTFYTAPGGAAWTLANLTGFTYDIGRGDSDTTTFLRISEVYLDITYQQLSTVAVTGPTGTTAATRPTVTWTYSSPDSQPQQSYQVGIYTAAQVAATGFSPLVTTPLQSSGVVLGEDLQWNLTSDLTDGQYYAYVQASSRWDGPGTFPTAIASTSWTRQAYVPPPALSTAGPPVPAVLSSATFDATNNRVALTIGPGTQPTISAVGTAATSGGTGVTTLAVNPTAVGDVLVLATKLDTTSLTVSSVSGGGVTTWTRIAGPFVGSSTTLGLWMGVVTSAGSSTITITGSGALTSTVVRLLAQQFHASNGTSAQWGLAVAPAGVNNTSSTTVTFPSATPTGPNQVYVGYAMTASAASTSGATSGYTVELDNASHPFIYGPNSSTTQSPTVVQTTAGTSSAVGALIVAGEPATAYTVQASRDGGVTWLQPDGAPSIPSLTLIQANGTSTMNVYDYVANINEASQYRVISYSGPPYVAASSPSNVLSVTPYGDQHWLKHPANPLLNTPLPVAAPKQSADGIKVTKRQQQATYDLLSGTSQKVLPIVISGPVYGDQYEMELIFTEDSDPTGALYAAVQQLFTSGSTLLLQLPSGDQKWVAMGPGASGQDIVETYNAVSGDPTTVQWRRWKLLFTETGAPAYF